MIVADENLGVQTIIARLSRAAEFETVIEDRAAARRSLIRGSIEVLSHQPDSLTLRESGRYVPEQPGVAGTLNTLRWSAAHDTLTLDHLRHAGRDVPPTLLARFAFVAGGFRARPHACGNDIYDPALVLVGETGVELAWRVRGPRKDASIRTVYLGPG